MHVTDATFAAEVERQPGLTIVDFQAAWCAPCRLMDPVLDRIATERAGDVRVTRVDLDESQRTAARFNVRAAPTLLFFKDGTPVDRIVGAVPAARVEDMIARHL